MRLLYRQAISLLMLIAFFFAGSGAHGFSAKWVAHDLDHATALASVEHDVGHETQRNDKPDAPQPLSDGEHQLLHALAHCDPGSPCSFDVPPESTARSIPLPPTLQTVLSADPEPSFRPPRITSPI